MRTRPAHSTARRRMPGTAAAAVFAANTFCAARGSAAPAPRASTRRAASSRLAPGRGLQRIRHDRVGLAARKLALLEAIQLALQLGQRRARVLEEVVAGKVAAICREVALEARIAHHHRA